MSEKTELHPRNKHRERYDFERLMAVCGELKQHVFTNKYGSQTIDFFNPDAVKMLNMALIRSYYGVDYWDIPQGFLCPPIPGRADYIHHIADLLSSQFGGQVPSGENIKCLDIGVGANCIYPIIGSHEYGWHFVGSDIEDLSLASAANIVSKNDSLRGKIELRKQSSPSDIFRGVIMQDEYFHVTICNPPFHSSKAEAEHGSLRKLHNLTGKRTSNLQLNFAGQSNELWTEGGEELFIKRMIAQSREFSKSVRWFTTLISKESIIPKIERALQEIGARQVRIIPMVQGNKSSRIIAWRF